MAYNNYFPATYQPVGQMQNPALTGFQAPTAPFPQGGSGIVWVQGVEGAKAYPVAAGNSVLLMDSEAMVFYIKSTDASGMPQPLRVYDYKERVAEPQVTGDFVTRDELEQRLSEIDKPKTKSKKKEADDE